MRDPDPKLDIAVATWQGLRSETLPPASAEGGPALSTDRWRTGCRACSPDFSPRSWSARCCRAGREGEPRRAMRGIGQAARRTMPARQRRPPGRVQAPARGVAALKRRLRYAFRPAPCGANAWTATQAVTLVRNPG